MQQSNFIVAGDHAILVPPVYLPDADHSEAVCLGRSQRPHAASAENDDAAVEEVTDLVVPD